MDKHNGTLFLIVGPSGVGKDTLIDGASGALVSDEKFLFVTRTITRPSDAGGEVHLAIGVADFEEARRRGEFALCWYAHGLHYGIPFSIEALLKSGHHVVANVSRTVLDEAREKFPRVTIVSITSPPDLIRKRLVSRGRETVAEIDERVARAGAFFVQGPDVVHLVNDGPIDRGIASFLAVLTARADDGLGYAH